MSRKALLISELDESKINSGQLYNNSGCIIIPLTYGKKYESCYIQLPIFRHKLELIKHKYYDELLLVIDDSNKDEINQFIEKLDNKIIEIINEKKSIEPIFEGYTKIKYKNIIRMKDSLCIIKLKADHNSIFRKRINIDDMNYLANHTTAIIDRTDLRIGDFYRCIVQISSIWISENVFGVYMRPLIVEKLELTTIDFQETSKKPNYNNPLSSEDKINSNPNQVILEENQCNLSNEIDKNSESEKVDEKQLIMNELNKLDDSEQSSQTGSFIESLIDSE
jgi:hypothetical protein